jgi:hypothetical protein
VRDRQAVEHRGGDALMSFGLAQAVRSSRW